MNEQEFELALAALIAGALHLGLSSEQIALVLDKTNKEVLKQLLTWNYSNG